MHKESILIPKGTIFNFMGVPIELVKDTMFKADKGQIQKLIHQGYKLKKEFYYWEVEL